MNNMAINSERAPQSFQDIKIGQNTEKAIDTLVSLSKFRRVKKDEDGANSWLLLGRTR